MQGHVDGTAVLESLRSLENGNWELLARIPAALDRYLVFKAPIAIDGISLTIADISNGLLRVAIIPHTYAATNLSSRHTGDRLNIECDMLAKHAEKLLAWHCAAQSLTFFRTRKWHRISSAGNTRRHAVHTSAAIASRASARVIEDQIAAKRQFRGNDFHPKRRAFKRCEVIPGEVLEAAAARCSL